MSTPDIQSDNTMQEVLQAYPGAQRALMRKYHIGGCSSCGFEMGDQLGDVLKKHNVFDIDGVIEHIKASHEQEEQLQISPAELAESMKSDNPPRLLDVRSDVERETVMLADSVQVTQELVQEMMGSWAKDTPIVFYCHHGIRSMEAASYFIGHGFSNIRSLRGGIDAWAEQLDPSLPRY